MANDSATIRGKGKKEAFHREAEGRITPFSFKRPTDGLDSSKAVFYLAHSDLFMATMQIIIEGGDNNLHYHPGRDSLWMVMKGRVRFHGAHGVIGEYGPHEGLITPHNTRYWFESASEDEELHLLHIETANRRKNQKNRVNLTPKRPGQSPNKRIGYPAGLRHE